MTRSSPRRHVRLLLAIAVPLMLLAFIRPWTVRPIETPKAAFDGSVFAATAWPRLQREATETAIALAQVPATTGPPVKARFVRGTGTVTAVDRRLRVGVLRVQLSGPGPSAVAIQIGPVIRGTALRDASSFIHFSDFVNQFDYAGAANALNDYALRTVVGAVPVDQLVGRPVNFIGAVGKSSPREDGAVEIVAVQLTAREDKER